MEIKSMKYCTYLTIYTGTKMPIFYIGRSNIKNIQNGYRGSVSSKLYKQVWLEELKHNPHLFKTKILTTHATQEEAAAQEEYFHKKYQVHKNPLYINRATGAGTFCADIRGKKNPFYGTSRVGELNPMYGKTHNAESRKKMSNSHQGKHSNPKSLQHKQAIRDALIGRSYEDLHGKERAAEIKAKLKKPKTEEHKRKQSLIMKNKPKIECQHCGILCSATNYKRWHGSNCKSLTKKVSNKY